MHNSAIITLLALSASVTAAPYSPFPLPDGFPDPSPTQLAEIETLAQGTLPNGALPSSLTKTGVATLQLIALNEIFEVAFFTSLLSNVTNNVTGYDAAAIAPLDYTYTIDTLTAVVNQEQLHAAGVNGILANAGQMTIAPCEYMFPVATFVDAVALAQTFTDVVLGTLQEAQAAFSADGGDESPLVPLFGSVIGQEGEQNGFYRYVQGKTASSAPFLTRSSPPFAFTALQMFIVPGSCPQDLAAIGLPTFGLLEVVTTPEAMNMTLEFAAPGDVGPDTNSIVYLSGQNLPVTVPIGPVTSIAGFSHFNASFPFDSGFSHGLTIAALVNSTGETFASADAVAAATLFGPGLIEVG